jgi:hypothetical protein
MVQSLLVIWGMKTAPFLMILPFVVLASLTRAAAPPVNGVYALTPLNPSTSQIPHAVLTNPAVDGIALRVGWSVLEPNANAFQWGEIDNVIALATSYGKTVSISVEAGIESPAWVYADGAQSFKFVWNLPWGPAQCTVVSIPVPWDEVFQAKWGQFVAAFGARYGSNPYVSMVKLTGLNSSTEETWLANSTAGTPINGGRCRAMNDVQNWRNIGYTRAKVESAWLAMANDFDRAFPNKQFAAMLVPGGFPPIDSYGNLIPKASCDYQVSTDILNDGLTDYGPGVFVAQNNGLSNTWIWSVMVNTAPKGETGFQMTSPLGSKLPQAINLALQSSASFLEIYDGDLTTPSLQSAIQRAHVAMAGN